MFHCRAQNIIKIALISYSGIIVLNSCPCDLMKAEYLMQFKRLVTQKRFLRYGNRGKQLFLFNYALLLVIYLVVLADKFFLACLNKDILLSTTTVPTRTCLRHVSSPLSIKN